MTPTALDLPKWFAVLQKLNAERDRDVNSRAKKLLQQFLLTAQAEAIEMLKTSSLMTKTTNRLIFLRSRFKISVNPST
jgi:hypothetical protein